LSSTSENYYNLAWIYQKLSNYKNAEIIYLKAINLDSTYFDAYIQLTYIKLHQKKLDAALKSANAAVNIDNKSKKAYLLRSIVFKKKENYTAAIKDLSKLINIYPNDITSYLYRGIVYQELNKHIDAINDFTKVLKFDKKNINAIKKRAKSYEKINDYNNAVKDYQNLCFLNKNDKNYKELLAIAREKLFELNREENPPVLKIIVPKQKTENVIEVAGKLKEVLIKLKIEDDSPISKLVIEGKNIEFDKASIKNGFYTTVNIDSKKEISFEVEDIYNNRGIYVYSLKKSEINKPKIKISSHSVLSNNSIYLYTNKANIYLKGIVEDESLIKSITINEIEASYNKDNRNPKFFATINIEAQEKIIIKVTDIKDNLTKKEYKLDRSGIELLKKNPMGKTWVVFIENSDYSSFTSLKGPSKDIRLMKAALSKYQIHKIIHKRNLSKKQMQKFFSTELKNLIIRNHVNSILVWYAGHGKFINSNGYWIPTNANRDNENSYYNMNLLKTSMQTYSKNITHTLIITDACESGTSFYNAMRSIQADKNCDDKQATHAKSSQVFTSSGYDLSAENSQFTKTFAQSLNHNTNSCMSIEKVVYKVSAAVKKNSKKIPKFGRISGFANDNGTFFFIKK